MKCPVCSETELVHDTRRLRYICDGDVTIIPAVVGDYCPVCDEAVFDAAESTRVSAAMLAFRRSKADEARSN
jgi:HTH-type transcriptional regulator/antitoxin MqsA